MMFLKKIQFSFVHIIDLQTIYYSHLATQLHESIIKLLNSAVSLSHIIELVVSTFQVYNGMMEVVSFSLISFIGMKSIFCS